MDWNTFIEWLNELVKALQNPYFLVFFASLVIGCVIKSLKETFPDWLLPAFLAVLGLVSGALLLGTGAVGRFQGALAGLTLALASTGFHQAVKQVFDRFNKQNSKPEVQK